MTSTPVPPLALEDDEQARRKFRYELQQLRPALVEFAALGLR